MYFSALFGLNKGKNICYNKRYSKFILKGEKDVKKNGP